MGLNLDAGTDLCDKLLLLYPLPTNTYHLTPLIGNQFGLCEHLRWHLTYTQTLTV